MQGSKICAFCRPRREAVLLPPSAPEGAAPRLTGGPGGAGEKPEPGELLVVPKKASGSALVSVDGRSKHSSEYVRRVDRHSEFVVSAPWNG